MTRMKSASVVASAVALVVAIAVVRQLPAQTAQTPPAAGRVSEAAHVQALLKQHNVPGVSIAVIKDFKIVATYAYGVADAATGAPVTADTLFHAASISKPVAAMPSLKALQNGLLTLDQPVNTVLRTWKLPPSTLIRH